MKGDVQLAVAKAREAVAMGASRGARATARASIASDVPTLERLGSEEIEVGGAPFAASDQVITRINDCRAGIYNRERWEVASVDAEQRRVVLDGIDQARRSRSGRTT